MYEERTEKRREFIINTVYFALVGAIAFVCLKYVVSWVMPFIIGLLFVLAAKPPVDAICKATRINRKVCAVAVLLIYYALIIMLLWILGAKMVSTLKGLFTHLPQYYNDSIYPFIQKMNKLLVDLATRISPDTLNQLYDMMQNVTDNIREFIVKFSSGMVSYLAGLTAKLPFFLISLVFSILASVFISLDYDKIKEFLKKQMSPKTAEFLCDAKQHLGRTFSGYLRAYFIILLITFTELSIGLSILKIKGAIGIAALIAVLDILPVIGTGWMIIPWGIISLINGNYIVGAGLLILYVIILVVRNFTEPKIVGDQLGLNPVVTLIVIYLGYRWFGVSGMIMLPVAVTILVGLHKTGRIKLWVD